MDRPRTLVTLRLLTLATGLVGLGGCVEDAPMPTAPAGPADPGGPWTRVWPAVSCEYLAAAWGMDADDMWAVGESGTILHYDGRRVVAFDPGTRDDLRDIDGCARDDVWAVADHAILHWDGHAWTESRRESAEHYYTVCCIGRDEVYVGGTLENEPVNDGPLLLRYDGGAWHRPPCGRAPGGAVRRGWRPGPEYPLFAATADSLFLRADGPWRPTDLQGYVGDADGIRVLLDPHGDWYQCMLFTILPDGRLDIECYDSFFANADQLTLSRSLLVSSGVNVYRLDDCLEHQVYDGFWWTIRDLAVPELPGPSGLTAFAVGGGALFVRLAWQGGTMVATPLGPQPGPYPERQLTAADGRLYAIGSYSRLVRLEGADWQPVETPFDPTDLRALADGRLVIANGREIAVASGDLSTWQRLPDCPVSMYRYWIDTSLEPRVVTQYGELWALEAMSWAQVDTVPNAGGLMLTDLDGVSNHEIYVSGFDYDGTFCLRYDGGAWTEILDGDYAVFYLDQGLFSRRVYTQGRRDDLGWFTGYLQDGELTVFLTPSLSLRDIAEASADLAYGCDSDGLYAFDPNGWVPLDAPEATDFRYLAADPGLGLYVLTDRLDLFHRPLPQGAP